MSKTPPVSPDDFSKWRSPVRGAGNPEVMDNAFWKWCIRTRKSAYSANKEFGGPSPFSAGPGWCFDRMGQAHVALPDGRDVYIAGEHEDGYDPDFYIYNDVVIVDGEEITILGYPESVFPPTDFHTATLVGSEIFLIGNLGYTENCVPDKTQVFRLDTNTWHMRRVETTGTPPGWIYDHKAVKSDEEDAILISGGEIGAERSLENIDDYRLSLADFTWTKLTDRKWERWILERDDGEANGLWDIRSRSLARECGPAMEEAISQLPPEIAEFYATDVSDDDIEQIESLYKSPFTDNAAVEDEEEFGRYRLDVQGTTVRFDEDMDRIVVTIEGQLPAEVVNEIVAQLKEKLSRLEDTAYTVTRVG